MITTEDQRKELEALSRPVMEWLNNNFNPHVHVTITPTTAEFFEGLCSTGQILDYIKD